ncbi:MAG: T9SS type A sorting domain-containing protein [Saprospiraceae bacterium]
MKHNILLSLFFILFIFQSNGQGIFDASIHTAIEFGSVNSPFAEGPQEIIDQNSMTKFLDFFAADGMGFEVDMLGVTSVVNTIQIVTANDAPERDPTTYEIFGSTDGTNYTTIVTGEIPCVAERFLPRYFGFPNTIAYSFYRVNFTGVCGTSDIIQVADVQLYPTIGNAPTIGCAADVITGSSAGECGGVVEYDITATDVEDGMLTPTITSGFESGSVFPIGTSSIVFSVTDSDNNTVSCDFTITISDTESPTTTCPDDITVALADPNDMTAVVEFDLGIMDNCSPINPLDGYVALGSIEGKAYYLSDSVFTAQEAFDDAVLQGGMVGSIRSAEDNEFLLDAILRNNNGVGDVLIGLNDVEFEGLFVWDDDEFPYYDNWNIGEPNNAGVGGVSENYTIILTSGLWNDVDSIQERRYLLEVDYEPIQIQGLSSGSGFPIGTTTNSFEIWDAAGNMTLCEFDITVDDEVSVEDQELFNGISISPNPSTDIMVIHNKSNINLENAIIYDLQGKMIYSINFQSAKKYHSLDLTDWNSGIYLMRIKGEKGVVTKKLIKL